MFWKFPLTTTEEKAETVKLVQLAFGDRD